MPVAAEIPDPQQTPGPERILGEDGGRAYRNFLAWTPGGGFALAVLEVTEPRRRDELLAWTRAHVPGTREAQMDQAAGKPLRPLLDGPARRPASRRCWC